MRLIDATPLEEGGYKLERRRVHNGCEVIEGMSVSCVPTIDAELVRHGKWINDKGLYKCSVCNEFSITGWANCIPIEQMNKTMKYCNNCGARMDSK